MSVLAQSWQAVGENVLTQALGSVLAVAVTAAVGRLMRRWRQRGSRNAGLNLQQVDDVGRVQE